MSQPWRSVRNIALLVLVPIFAAAIGEVLNAFGCSSHTERIVCVVFGAFAGIAYWQSFREIVR